MFVSFHEIEKQIIYIFIEKYRQYTHPRQCLNDDYLSFPRTLPQVKQLEQQNERLKEAVVKMRDLNNHEKHEMQRAQKQAEKHSSEISGLQKEKVGLT